VVYCYHSTTTRLCWWMFIRWYHSGM